MNIFLFNCERALKSQQVINCIVHTVQQSIFTSLEVNPLKACIKNGRDIALIFCPDGFMLWNNIVHVSNFE